MVSKKKIFTIVICIIVIVAIIAGVFVTHNKKNQPKQAAEEFSSDFFKWDSDRGEELMQGEDAFNKRWGEYLTSSAISNLLEDRSPIKYDLLYGTNHNVAVQNIECEFEENQTCNFSLDVVYADENGESKIMNIKGQLLFQNDGRIDNVYFYIK